MKDTINKTYKCNCHFYHYLEFSDLSYDELGEYYFVFIEQPKSLWHWLKRLFKKRSTVSEIILNRDQLKDLSKEITKALKKEKHEK